jgi:hypothetical protein
MWGKSLKFVRNDRAIYETNKIGVLVPEDVKNVFFLIHSFKAHSRILLGALANVLMSLRCPKRYEISCPTKRLLATTK